MPEETGLCTATASSFINANQHTDFWIARHPEPQPWKGEPRAEHWFANTANCSAPPVLFHNTFF